MKKNDINDYNFKIKNFNYRIVTYRVNNSEEDYYLFTNLMYKSIEDLKELY